ncbi:substrate-binding domain-containing protein [Paracoccus marinaquae]|uniref:Substrate-binding domain-containing protein n=1 Tax=Paracoccus marinaquae TaxID=2841926 RepID=A0ABS6AKT8_9RHOB|nr:substrate-binding domain-containing protein [Paracoccus marinaquae]MBU3030732.1 substrate-binding domain-containing protein [Paracoccus marinaquae]
MRKLFATTLAALSLAVTPALAQDEQPFKGSEEDQYYMITFVSGVEYWFPVYEMMKQAGQQLGVDTVYTGTPEYDVTKQLAVFEQVLARNPKGILIAPMNPEPFIEPINRAAEMGIPVVTFGADSPNSKRVAFVTSDNAREGQVAADAVAEAMGGKGQYAVLENPGQDNHDRRIAAFIGRMESNWPDMELVARAASNQDPTKAYNAVLSMAQANPELGAIFMPEANSALGAAQAAKELNTGIKVMLTDVNGKILDMLKAGEVFGSLNPNQGIQGYMGMMMLYLAANSDMIDPMNATSQTGENPFAGVVIDNGLAVVTSENADFFYWDKYLERRGTDGIKE